MLFMKTTTSFRMIIDRAKLDVNTIPLQLSEIYEDYDMHVFENIIHDNFEFEYLFLNLFNNYMIDLFRKMKIRTNSDSYYSATSIFKRKEFK